MELSDTEDAGRSHQPRGEFIHPDRLRQRTEPRTAYGALPPSRYGTYQSDIVPSWASHSGLSPAARDLHPTAPREPVPSHGRYPPRHAPAEPRRAEYEGYAPAPHRDRYQPPGHTQQPYSTFSSWPARADGLTWRWYLDPGATLFDTRRGSHPHAPAPRDRVCVGVDHPPCDMIGGMAKGVSCMVGLSTRPSPTWPTPSSCW
jgi:hypothetical protein